MAAPYFVKTGMPRKRFGDLMRYLVRPDDMSHDKYRWLLVDGFVNNINEYRAKYFNHSDIIFVDESISLCYGQGCHWINHGLPIHVSINIKTKNGCGIHNACCGRSTIMMRLKLVNTSEEELTHTVPDSETGLLHGTCILFFLIGYWTYST